MISNENRRECSGCGACYNICPKKCISMVENKEGFKEPKVDKEKCIDCGMCNKVCQINNKKIESAFYYGWSKDEANRKNSSSGGIFGEIGKKIIENNGIVFGAGFDENLNIVHKEAKTLIELEDLKGSKYVQSDIGNCYQRAKNYLEEGKEVLFSGTPCQINGLYKYLQKEYEKLYTIDVICHGAASPKVYRKYLYELEKKYNSKVKTVSFRDKTYGWKTFSLKIVFENGKTYVKKLTEDLFIQGFLKNVYLRESCYNCKFATLQRQGDITLGDFWGFDKKYREIYDDKGVSIILVNSKKGEYYFNKCKENIDFTIIEDTNFVIQNNTSLIKPVQVNKKRKKFFNNIDKLTFEEMYKKYIQERNTSKYLNIIKRKIHNLIKLNK